MAKDVGVTNMERYLEVRVAVRVAVRVRVTVGLRALCYSLGPRLRKRNIKKCTLHEPRLGAKKNPRAGRGFCTRVHVHSVTSGIRLSSRKRFCVAGTGVSSRGGLLVGAARRARACSSHCRGVRRRAVRVCFAGRAWRRAHCNCTPHTVHMHTATNTRVGYTVGYTRRLHSRFTCWCCAKKTLSSAA